MEKVLTPDYYLLKEEFKNQSGPFWIILTVSRAEFSTLWENYFYITQIEPEKDTGDLGSTQRGSIFQSSYAWGRYETFEETFKALRASVRQLKKRLREEKQA